MKPYIRHFLMITAAMMSIASMNADPIDTDAAQHAAQEFLNSQQGKLLTAPNASMKLEHAEYTTGNAKVADYYVFIIETVKVLSSSAVMTAPDRYWPMVTATLT